MLSCPGCESHRTVKHGSIHNGKQNYRCRDCGRQFVQAHSTKRLTKQRKL